MQKEDILEMSRKENKKKDMMRVQVENTACKYAATTIVILAAIYFAYEIFTGKGTNYALYSIITLYDAILYGYYAAKLEENKKLNTFSCVIWSLLTIGLVISYFMKG